MTASFADTNILVYAATREASKAAIANQLLSEAPTISIQVLNEVASVLFSKYHRSWDEIETFLGLLAKLCEVRPLDLDTHELGIAIARRHGFHIYDCMIVASALRAGCEVLYSEDMHHGLQLDGLIIINPFIVG